MIQWIEALPNFFYFTEDRSYVVYHTPGYSPEWGLICLLNNEAVGGYGSAADGKASAYYHAKKVHGIELEKPVTQDEDE